VERKPSLSITTTTKKSTHQPKPPSPTTSMASDSKGPSIANPTPFNGDRNRSKYFLQQCELVFNAREKDFQIAGTPPTENHKAKISYALSYMKEGNALAWASKLMESALPSTWKDFKTLFETTFKSLNNDEKARAMIQRLLQGRHSVDAYTATFNTWKVDSGWNEQALIDAYLKGLNPDIQNRLQAMDQIPTTLDKIQEKAAAFDINRTTNQMRFGRWNQPVYPDTAFEIPRPRFQGQQRTQTPGQGTRHDPIVINRTQLSQEERAQYMKEGRCFKCRQKGHMARECPEYQGGVKPNYQGNKNNQRYQNNPRPPMRARVAQIMEICQNCDPEEIGEVMMAIREGQDFSTTD
jgi:hypothetical protein